MSYHVLFQYVSMMFAMFAYKEPPSKDLPPKRPPKAPDAWPIELKMAALALASMNGRWDWNGLKWQIFMNSYYIISLSASINIVSFLNWEYWGSWNHLSADCMCVREIWDVGTVKSSDLVKERCISHRIPGNPSKPASQTSVTLEKYLYNPSNCCHPFATLLLCLLYELTETWAILGKWAPKGGLVTLATQLLCC